jgi:hypothetical protein
MPRTSSTRSPWWSRSRGLPAAAYASWIESLPPGPTRILAWARTGDGFCIGSPSRLSLSEGDQWRHVGWHEIERGGWDAESGVLTWTELAAPGEKGVPGSVALTEPGRLPELFRERVSATIAVEKFVALTGSRGVVITARRDLGADGGISWHSALTRGLTWETEGVRGAVDRAMAELRLEYDLR